jgi:hypothetical protein
VIFYKPPWESCHELRAQRVRNSKVFCENFVAMDDFPDVIPQSLPGGAPLKRIQRGASLRRKGRTVPVYAPSDSGPRGVPTGRALIRFSDEINFNEKTAEIAAAGSVVDPDLCGAEFVVMVVSV